jgi:large subunit ribosomal protein L21
MSYAIIKTGGKQFPVEDGQVLRVPTIEGKAGDKVDIQALVSGAGKDAKIGGVATVQATVLGHGKGDKIIVFKKKRRKQYKRTQGHRQGYTEIKIEKI